MKKNKKINKKPFYYRFVEVERIFVQLKKMDLLQEEKREILDLIGETIHTRVIDATLERLPREKHESFLERVVKDPTDPEIYSLLEEVEDLESHLEKIFQALEEEILADLSQ